jgi:hypothetical protein
MIRTVVALCMLLAAIPVAQAESRGIAGAWTASVSDDRPERLDFSLRTGRTGQNGSPFDRSAFTGLTSEQVASEKQVPVQFELRREAGTIAFEGTFRDGQGAGQFSFLPNREFPKALRSLGVDFVAKRGSEDQELFSLALFDVTAEFIRSMQAIGYSVPLEKYEEFRIFRVDPAYVREMTSVGFDKLSADKLVSTRIHGATPEYIRHMRSSGNDLTLDEYIESRIFQVTPEFASEMSRAGYPDLDHDTLIQFRIHDVSAEFIRQLREVGYSRIPPQQLVEMRIHGVTPEFIRRVAAAGYRKVPVEKLVQMRIFDIEPEMVKALDKAAH